MAKTRKTICLVTASSYTMNAFLAPAALALQRKYVITLVCDADRGELKLPLRNLTQKRVRIARNIQWGNDLSAFWKIWSLFYKKKFSAVHSMSPKAGLLSMTAAWLAGISVRIHTFTGQVWATRAGLMRWLLRQTDKLTACLATHVLVDSPSQLRFLRAEGILARNQGKVLAKGSVVGVDLGRFRPDPRSRLGIRRSLGISQSSVVALFVGRFQPDKGLRDLGVAFNLTAPSAKNLHLLLVGPDEAGMANSLRELTREFSSRIHFTGSTNQPEKAMAAADFLVLPSYREGFGSVVIEAAACAIPAIVTRIYGLKDAVQEGKTGAFVPPGDPEALARAMLFFYQRPAQRRAMGWAAQRRVRRDFEQGAVVRAIVRHHAKALR